MKFGNTPLKNEDETIYLGVTFHKQQTSKPLMQKGNTNSRRKLAIMRKLEEQTLDKIQTYILEL